MHTYIHIQSYMACKIRCPRQKDKDEMETRNGYWQSLYDVCIRLARPSRVKTQTDVDTDKGKYLYKYVEICIENNKYIVK